MCTFWTQVLIMEYWSSWECWCFRRSVTFSMSSLSSLSPLGCTIVIVTTVILWCKVALSRPPRQGKIRKHKTRKQQGTNDDDFLDTLETARYINYDFLDTLKTVRYIDDDNQTSVECISRMQLTSILVCPLNLHSHQQRLHGQNTEGILWYIFPLELHTRVT